MKISTPMIVGLGAAVILIIILIVVASGDGGDEEDEEVSGEIDEDMAQELLDMDASLTTPPLEPPATCATHTCPDDYVKEHDDVVGDTDDICCRKPLCDADTIQCPGEKVVTLNARGVNPDECCELPFCTEKAGGVCNSPSLELINTEKRGTTDAECCKTLPSCSSHVCGSGYKNAADAASRYGTSDGECCVLKTCGENKWGIANGRKCTSKGMKWVSENADLVGDSEDTCCIEATCFENGFTLDKCSNPRKGGSFGYTPLMSNEDDAEVLGQTHEQCCAPSQCSEEPVIECPPGKKHKTPVPYATTQEDCCEDIKCGEWYVGNDCGPNMKEKGDNEIGNNESQCCRVKTCSDVESDGPCDEGTSVTITAPLPSGYAAGNYQSSCCTAIKCNSPESTYKTEAGCNIAPPELLDEDVRDRTISTYALFKPINPLPADKDAQQDNCCEPKLCSEVTNIDCNNIGQKKDLEQNGKAWNHDDKGGKGCCKPKTCEDLKGEGGMSCPAGQQEKDDLETLMMTNLTGSETSSQKLTEFQDSCCRGQKCSDITPNCSAISINGTTDVMVVDDRKGNAEIKGTNHKACCKFKTCSQLGWDDAKCKDKNYTRAAYRGGLKDGSAEGRPPTTEDRATIRAVSDGWGSVNLGDKLCCEQKEKTTSGGNYARQCVAKEYNYNQYKRKSPGVWTARYMGPKLNSSTIKVANAAACKAKCDQNQSCDNFTIARDGECNLYRGGSAAGETAYDLHGGVPLRGIIGVELGGGTSTANGHTRGIHYITKNTFKDWDNYLDTVGKTPWYTGKPDQKLITIGEGMTMDDIKDDRRRKQLTTEADAGNCNSATGDELRFLGYRHNHPHTDCANITWKGRREVLLAGVDEEFCPYDFVQGWDYGKTIGQDMGDDAPARPAFIGGTHQNSSTFKPLAADSKVCHEMNRGGYGSGNANSKSVQEAINSCYSDPNCATMFVNTGGTLPWNPASSHKHERRIDETSSRISVAGKRNLVESSHSRWTRRICYKHHVSTDARVTMPAANDQPGANLIKTRYKNTREANKLYTGRMPDKSVFSGAFPVETNLLLPGDTAK